jgi:hypothetical protein
MEWGSLFSEDLEIPKFPYQGGSDELVGKPT